MTERAHNAISEFARVVRANSPREHTKKLAGSYSTPFALALGALGINQFNKTEPIKSWRRGKCAPPDWAIQIVRDELVRNAEWNYTISELLRQAKGPGRGDRTGIQVARWRAKLAEEKEKGAEAPNSQS